MPENKESIQDIWKEVDNSKKKSTLSNTKSQVYNELDKSYDIPDSQYLGGLNSFGVNNISELQGVKQPWYDKAANGVVNMAGRTVTSAAEGILNPFIGTFYAIRDQKLSSYIDNPFTSLIDETDKQIKEAVPFYQTKEEGNAHGLSKLAYGNTYFRDVLDGVGFSLGAMATGGVYNKIINTLGKTALVGKTGDFINKLNTIDAAPDKLKYIDQVNTLNSVKDGAKKGLIAGFTATAESEMNARSDAKEFKTARIKEIIDSGRQPSNEELAQIDTLSEEILTSSFALNMPIIMLDNWITFGKSVFGNKVTDKLNLTEIGEKVTKEGFDGSYKLAKKASIDKVLDKTYGVRKFVEPMIAEGFFQEQSQYGITKGVNDYYKKKFYNPEAADFIESFGEGVYQAYGTKEGWDNGIIGALSGGAMGNVTTLATQGASAYSNPNDITSVPSQLSNLSTVKSYKTLVEKAMRHGNLMEEQKQALKNNDTFTYENAKNDDFINYAGTKIAYGKTQDLLDELNEFKSMSEEEFKSNFGNELSTDEITKSKQTVGQFVQEKINKVQQIKRAYDIINEKFPSASEGNKERLAYASLTIDNAKERKSKLNQEAKQLLTKNIHFTGNLGDTNPLMLLGNDYLNLSKENKKLYKKALLDANMNPMDLDETLDKLVDIDKLQAREEQFVKEYKELTKPHVQAANDVVDKKAETKIVEEATKEIKEESKPEEIATSSNGTYTIKSFVDKLEAGETLSGDEAEQFYANNKEEIEAEALSRQQNNKGTDQSDNYYNEIAKTLKEKFPEYNLTNRRESSKDGKFITVDGDGKQIPDEINLEIEKTIEEISNKYFPKDTIEDSINESEVDDTNVSTNVSSIEVTKGGKIAQTPFKTESGLDDDSDENRTRYFRYIEKNKLADKRLLIVTKNNNPKLYNEILNLRPEAKEFESKNKDYKGIYVVISNKNSTPILVDNKLIFSTLTTVQRLKEGGVKASKEDEVKLTKLREDILVNKSPNIYLPIIGKSKGIIEFLPKIENKRQSNSVVGRIANSIKDAQLELLTAVAYGQTNLGELPNGLLAKVGKLYIKDEATGNWIDLVPRKLNSDELLIAFELINQWMGVTPKKVANPKKELEKIVFVGISKRGANEYTISVKDGNLLIGTESLSKEEFNTEEGRNKLAKALQNKYVNISKEFDLNDKFLAPKSDDKQNSKEYTSYKEYLLEGEASPMFGTDIPTRVEVQYRNQYLIYSPTVKEDTIKVETTSSTQLNKDEDVVVETLNLDGVSEESPKEKEKKDESPKKLTKITRTSKPGRKLDRLATPKTLNAPKLTNEELTWFKTNFPNISIEKIQGLIEGKSLGRFLSEGRILLSEEATMGTLYHEAFHTVTQLYLSKEEINKLYAEAIKQFPKKSRLELEEILAEDFIDYKNTSRILNNRVQRNTIFRRLLNVIKDFLKIKASSIEDVYRRLDKGFYKSKPIIGVREFTALDRIAGFSVSDTKKILDEIDASFYEILLDDNDKTIGDLYSKPELVNKILGIIKEELSSNELIKENWNSIIKAWADRFKSISGEIDLGEDFINDVGNDSVIKDEVADSRQGDALQEFNTISTKSLINKETRLLIRGLKQKEISENGELIDKLTDIGTKIPVEFNKTYNLILKNLQGISEWQDQYNKLIELSEKHPELIALVDRLGAPSGDISMDKFLQWMKFRQDFDKNKIDSFITIIEANGNVYIINAVSQVVYDRVKEEWRNNIKTKAILSDNGKLIVPVEITNIKNNIDFLAELGITFSTDAIENTKNNSDFNQSINQLRIYVSNKKGDVTNLFSDDVISTRMNLLYTIEGDVSKTVNELSFISTEGKTVYSITQNNALAIVKNIINNSDNIQEVYTKLPHLNTVSTKNSIWMSKLFNDDGSRNKDITLDLDLHDGMKNSNKSIEETELELGTEETSKKTNKTKSKAKKEASTRKLSIGEKYVQEINSLLTTGKSSYIRASDKASEFVLSLNKSNSKSKLIIPIDKLAKSIDIQEVREVFKNYFKAELERIALFELKGLGKNIDQYNNNGGKFTLFEGFDINKKDIKERILALDNSISEEDLIKELDIIYNEFEENISVGIVKYLTNYSNEIRNKLSEYNITHGQGIAAQFKINSLDQISRTVAVNDLINTIEQIKLFVGDMSFYKDLFKRTAAFTGTKETSAVGEEINSFLNSNNKRVDNKVANDKINVTVFEDSVQQALFIEDYIQALIDNGYSPKEARNILSAYYDMEEGDAQGWITLDEYREFGIRRGDWSNGQEQAFGKLQKGETLSPKELSVFLTLKAQYAGPQEYNGLYAPAYHKFSLLPLIPQLVKDTNLQVLLETMSNKNNQTGYALFKTGSKVGTRLNADGKVTPFYNKEGDLNTKDWVNQVVDYRFFGLQVKSSEPKAKVIFGTQFRKLLFLDLFENGNSKFKDDYDDYNNIISELVENEKAKLIKELGINTSNYNIENVTSLVKLLQDEAKKRNLANNIIEAIQSEIIEGKTILKYNLDTMVNKDKIDSMIMSLIDSRLIRQKMNGDSLVQASIAGFEKAGIRKSNTLKFYKQDENGSTIDAECKISMSRDFYPLLKEYKTLDKLNQAIKNNNLNQEHKALLKLVGYRIPTQGLNSMESLEIVEFLPETTNTIILPTELVAKSGGDFDIDKLNIFRKNPLKDFNYIYKNIQNIINEDITRFNEVINDGSAESNLIKSIFSDNILDEKQELETLRELKVSKEQFDKFKKLADKTEFELYYKKQLAQNKIIDIAKKILTDKDNFVNLITPNTTKDLKGLANQFDYEEYLNKKREEAKDKNKEFKPVSFEEYLTNQKAQAKNIRYTDQLKLTTKIDQFYKFMLAKDMIGIAAIANTHHSLSQQVNASLNTFYSVQNPFSGIREPKFVNINFPHNKLEDGRISLSSIKDAKGINKISDIISQIINATVDAAKDPFMFTINMTKDTLSTYLYLIRIGVPFNMVGNFMKQPVITEYLKQLSINNSSYNNSKKSNKSIQTELILKYLADLNFKYTRRPNSSGGSTTIDTKHFIGIKSIKDLKAKYKELAVKNHPDKGGKTEVMQEINNEYDVLKKYPFLLNSNITEEETTEATLIGDDDSGDTISPDNIFFENEEQLSQFLNKENQTSQLFFKTQLQVLEDFLKYKEQASLLGDAMRASNIDTAGVGKNLGSVYNKKELIKKVKKDGFFNGLDKIFQETFIGAMNVNDFVIGAYSPLYYTQNTPEIVNNTNDLINEIKETLFPFGDLEYNKLRKLIENDFVNYVIQNYGYKDIKTLQNRIFKTESVAKRLIEAKKDETLKDNLLVQELFPLIAQINKNLDNVKIFTKRYDTYTANLLTESFRELGESDNQTAKQLYQDLMDLGIIQSGLNNSPITYLGLIPYEYYNDLAKRAFEEFNKKNGVDELNKFNELFVRENSSDALVYRYALKVKLNGKTKGYGIYGKVFDKNTANNLENSEKSSILDKREIIQPKGKPPIDLTEENNC